MNIFNKILSAIFILGLLVPSSALALDMPKNGSELAEMTGINATAYAVFDIQTGDILIEKNADLPWVPASLTKLLTVLVVLDTKPKLSKLVSMTKADQEVGACSQGGGCIRAATGVKFSVDGLFHAALIPSANNAAAALARSTGLSADAFAQRMNEKAKTLGATSTHFVEPTGMSVDNVITAGDYIKIVKAAFSNPYIVKVAQSKSYALKSPNNSRYNQTLKNTDKLLSNLDTKILVAKTGYLNESKYNFASVVSYHDGPEMAVVVLGESSRDMAFAETSLLAKLAGDARSLASN